MGRPRACSLRSARTSEFAMPDLIIIQA